MEKLRLRCPLCAKLYEVCVADIKSHLPQFDCVSCSTRFSFQYPVTNLQEIQTFTLVKNSVDREKQNLSACPKCGALNAKNGNKFGSKGTEECYACHVILSRLEDLPLDPTLKAQPSLVRKWKNLMLNFDNRDLHEDFLNSCYQLDALRFAILKYEELKSAQGGTDEISQGMLLKAQGLLQVVLSRKAEGDLSFQQRPAAPRQIWHKYILWAPVCVSILMISIGSFSLGLRNLVGAGVAMILLTFGLILFWKGRISLSDFHQ